MLSRCQHMTQFNSLHLRFELFKNELFIGESRGNVARTNQIATFGYVSRTDKITAVGCTCTNQCHACVSRQNASRANTAVSHFAESIVVFF